MITGVFGAFLDAELAQAKRENKLILLGIESANCPFCLKMDREIFRVPEKMQTIQKQYIHVRRSNKDTELPKDLRAKYSPTHFVLSAKGDKLVIIDEFTGYMGADHFLDMPSEVYKSEFSPKN